MLRVPQEALEQFEEKYDGIILQIMRYEYAELPSCPHCGSANTAQVGIGIIGRSVYISAATTKYCIIANGPKPGEYFCSDCRKFYDD